MTCPRCLSTDVTEDGCRACHLAYDSPRAYEEHTREHTMVKKRWEKWRTVDRPAAAKKRTEYLLGL